MSVGWLVTVEWANPIAVIGIPTPYTVDVRADDKSSIAGKWLMGTLQICRVPLVFCYRIKLTNCVCFTSGLPYWRRKLSGLARISSDFLTNGYPDKQDSFACCFHHNIGCNAILVKIFQLSNSLISQGFVQFPCLWIKVIHSEKAFCWRIIRRVFFKIFD